MKKLLAILSLFFVSCTHITYMMQKELLIIDDKGKKHVQPIGDPQVYIPKTRPDTVWHLVPRRIKYKIPNE